MLMLSKWYSSAHHRNVTSYIFQTLAGIMLARKLGLQKIEFFEPVVFFGALIGDEEICDVKFWREYLKGKGIIQIGPKGAIFKWWGYPSSFTDLLITA
jgi:hypothetical protein